MGRLKNRRGAILVLTSFALVMMTIMFAFMVDLSRLYVQRNELQTGADAAALAGALRMVRDSNTVAAAAVGAASPNQVLNSTIALKTANVVCGVWDPATKVFSTPSGSSRCGTVANAVKVSRDDASRFLFQNVLNATNIAVATPAIAWAAPSVITTSCVRPWGIPYSLLLKKLDPSNTDTTRDLTATDLAKLASLPPSALTFSLKVGSPPTTPGNFGALDLAGNGGSGYRTDIGTCSNVVVGPGTVLATLPGNKVGPTTQGAADLCQPLYSNGDCGNGAGGIGLPIKAPLWYQTSGKGNGKFDVTVKIVGAFILTNVSSSAVVTGYFVRVADEGAITTTPSPLVKVVLVK